MSIFHRGQHKDPFPGPAPVPPDITQPFTRPENPLLAPETITFPPRPVPPAPPRALPVPVPAPPPPSSPEAIVITAIFTGEVLWLKDQNLLHLLDGETPRVSNTGEILPPEDATISGIVDKAVVVLARDRQPPWEPGPVDPSLRSLLLATVSDGW